MLINNFINMLKEPKLREFYLVSSLPLFKNKVTTSAQFSLVAQSWPTLCDLKDCSTPGLPVHHQLPELTQTHVH